MAEVVKLRSKVVEIEAIQFLGGAENASPIIDWVLENGGSATWDEAHYIPETDASDGGKVVNQFVPEGIHIRTLEGVMDAPPGWWIFKGLEGEFYPCKDSVKVAKYDEVTS